MENNANTAPASNPEQTTNEVKDNVAAPKKKRTGLIIGIILAILLLLGGGVFAAFAVIKNQPENIAAEAFNNLINTKQAAVSGTIAFTPKGEYTDIIGPVKITLDSKKNDANFSSGVTVSVDYGDYQKTIELEFGEVLLSNGVFYLKANGLKKIYDDFLSDMLVESLGSQTASTVAAIEDRIESIIKKIDDQWFEFSIEDILKNELISAYIDQDSKEAINKAYDCSVLMLNNISKYSNELSDLYSKNTFIALEPAENSFYKVSFDAINLTNYVNSLPNTKAVSDYASCNNLDNIEGMYSPISSSDVSMVIKNLPNIYTRFDGFLNHHLTGVKIEKEDEDYSLTSDMTLSYPANLNIAAPSDARPIMDVVQELIEDLTDFYQSI